VQILWELCEWQLVDPARFRALLKGEDEAVAWVRSSLMLQTSADSVAADRPNWMGQGW